MATFTALVDASVLASRVTRDLIVELAATDLFRIHWTERIHQEWMGAVKRQYGVPDETLEAVRKHLDDTTLDALIEGYEPVGVGLSLPDQNDVHVLAAAIAGRCDVIVTANTKHFPADLVTKNFPYIEVQHPDDFLTHQRSLNEQLFIQAARTVLNVRAPLTPDRFIERIADAQLPLTADALSRAKSLL